MFFFIIAIILALVLLFFAGYCRKTKDNAYDNYSKATGPLIAAAIIVALVGTLLSCVYTQDVGEVVILRNFGGQLAGTTEEAGLHLKAPWQDTIDYDIRNNIINLYRDDEYSYDNGTAHGAEGQILPALYREFRIINIPEYRHFVYETECRFFL